MRNRMKIIINTSEIVAGTRGASLGPGAIMTAARKENNYLFGKYLLTSIPNRNELLDRPSQFLYAKRGDGLLDIFDSIASEVRKTLEEDAFPFVIAGDHGSAGGTIAGIKTAFPDKRLGVVWIDAHADLHTPYTTPSGNMHGMPLATALGEDNLEEQRNEITKEEADIWKKLKEQGGIIPKLKPEDLIFIAVRDTEKEEDALMQRLNIKNHTVEDVRKKGKENIIKEIQNQLKDCHIIYVSFDVDSMDPKYTSYGTGTPVENGLMPEETMFFMKELAKWNKTVCMEVVEVNPCLDEKKNKMAEVAFEIIDKTIQQLNNGK